MKKQESNVKKSIKVKTRIKAGLIGRGTRGMASQATSRPTLL